MSFRASMRRYGRPAAIAVTSVAVAAIAIHPTLPYLIRELSIAAGTTSELFPMPLPTDATEPCRKGSVNCVRTTWTPTEAIETDEVIRVVRECLSQYPQEGQDGVDKGGWEIKEDKFNEGGSTRVEFRSGIGPFAKALNFGRPFVDDLLLQVQPDGKVQVRSSSRKGISDKGVNKKRIMYLTRCLPSSWQIPEPDYDDNL